MKYCKYCGFPVPYGKFLEWTSDGTILGRDSARTRLVYLDVDELVNLFNGIQNWVGTDIAHIIYRAEKEVGKRFIETLLPSFFAKVPRGKFARPEFGVRVIGNYIFNYMAGLGMGRAEILEYESGNFARVKIKDGHSIPLIAGDGAGVFEYLERIGVETDWQRVRSEEYILTIKKVSDQPEAGVAIPLPSSEYVPGNVIFNKCKRCGVPLEVTSNIYLDFEKGILRHKLTGMRVVALPVQSFNAVMRELGKEFGEELQTFIEALERKYFRENYTRPASMGKAGLDAIYEEFCWRGVGNPASAINTSAGVEVTVLNPFHPEAIAGRVAGLYESWTETTVRSTWSKEKEGIIKVLMQKISR